MKNYFAALLFLAAPGLVSAQAYFQQEVNYKIEVSLNDDKHELSGTEEIEYINQSPDRLSFIYFHLWPNAYKNNKTAYAKQAAQNGSLKFYFSKREDRGYIDGLAFEVNGRAARLEYEGEDVAKLILNEPLNPGEKIAIRTPFHVKIPAATSRLGHVGQSYQVTQWYPKPAVYDRQGWHQMPYLDQGEFFSEFGTFDVKITLPANYNVGATGILQTASEIARMDSLAAITANKTDFGNDMAFPPSAAQTKTLHYVQARIHDFAWFADKRFNILKSGVDITREVPIISAPNATDLGMPRRYVTTWLLFLNKNAPEWIKRKDDINLAIKKYSELVLDYPYEAATAVDGALGENVGGMEYPMVTVTTPSAVIHEVGHNWFYGIIGSNERDYPWMDESLNCYIEGRIAEEKDEDAGQLSFLLQHPLRKIFGLEEYTGAGLNYGIYKAGNSRGSDQPVSLHSKHYTTNNYGGIVYMKGPAVFKYLEEYLGRRRFDEAMMAYAARWRFKHPHPDDMQAVFEEKTGEKLDWFFKDLLQTTQPVDIAIKKFEKSKAGATVTLKNEGNFPAAAPVSALNEKGEILETLWVKPFEDKTTLQFTTDNIARFEVDKTYLLPETDRRDNQIRTTGLLLKVEKPRLQFLAGLNQNRKNQLYFTPVIGANTADKFMLGAAFYNSSVVAKKINYLLMPMYSFDQNQVNGIGHVDYNLATHGKGFIRQAIAGFTFNRFEYFRKYEPALTFNFRQHTRNAPWQQVKLTFTAIEQERSHIQYILDNPEYNFPFALMHRPENVNGQTISYTLAKKNAVQEIGFNLEFQHLGADPKEADNQSNALRSAITYQRYWHQKHKFSARLFGGKFFSQGEQPFFMGLSGSPDYLRETVFLDRAQKSDGIRGYADQTDGKDGGFKNYSSLVTDDWLTTLNLETEVPYLPLDIYLDLGRIAGHGETVYGTGLSLNIGKGFLSLYLPVAGSNFADTFPESFGDFRRNLRFSLRLNTLNPFKLLNEKL